MANLRHSFVGKVMWLCLVTLLLLSVSFVCNVSIHSDSIRFVLFCFVSCRVKRCSDLDMVAVTRGDIIVVIISQVYLSYCTTFGAAVWPCFDGEWICLRQETLLISRCFQNSKLIDTRHKRTWFGYLSYSDTSSWAVCGKVWIQEWTPNDMCVQKILDYMVKFWWLKKL